MATCTLQIGDRVVLTSVGGAPEVEYALFDPGEIELASTGPGMVQEVGYATSAEDALSRLGDAGMTLELALAAAAAMHPGIAIAYARGVSGRRIATFLGPAELFDGFEFDANDKRYTGYWIDLPALAGDAGAPQLTHMAQAFHLTALLSEVPATTRVHLSTREHMAGGRPGGRSHRRFSFAEATAVPERLRGFATRLHTVPRVERPIGPPREELQEVLRARARASPDADVQDRLRALETALDIREHPLRGPLADPQLWALDEQLSAGRPEGISDLLDTLEKVSGKGPGMVYLRARAALLSGKDPPQLIAERAASLALSMPSFLELELLAAEAWNAAGEPRKALPFSRDLISNTSLNDELRVRASQQFPAAPAQPTSVRPVAADPRRASTLPRLPAAEVPRDRLPTPAAPISKREREEAVERARPSRPPAATDSDRELEPQVPVLPLPVMALPSRSSPMGMRKETPAMVFELEDAPTVVPVPPATPSPTGDPAPEESPLPPPATGSSEGLFLRRATSGTWSGPPPSAPPRALRSPTMHFGVTLAPPAPGLVTPPSGPHVPSHPPDGSPPPPSAPRASTRPPGEPRLANGALSELMRGASQPPFRSDSPEAHLHIPKAPPAPHFGSEAEAAAALTLPEGLSGVPSSIETLPRTVLDARVQFTFLSRELGREYDEQLGIVLRGDSGGIEAMQRVLLDRYSRRSITTVEAAGDVRRHGAFLSEILARSFGAFWVDIGPSDVGYWAMVVPPSTRVWPFGRILRLIAMQHNERDLVSYFLELQAKNR